jgi:hypothetical protein
MRKPSRPTPPPAETRPRDVPGHAAAVGAGLSPGPAPTVPPEVTGPTAHRAMQVWIGAAAGAFLVLPWVMTAGVRGLGVSRWVWVAVVGAAIVGVVRGQRFVAGRNLAEFSRGYTTVAPSSGAFWFPARRRLPGQGNRLPWDYSGLWVFDGSGRTVRSRPVPGVEPPGYYPSPTRDGLLELWTGAVWARAYRDPGGG